MKPGELGWRRLFVIGVFAYTLGELWLALRPRDASELFREWLGTAHGRFEQFYSDWRSNERNSGAPLGE